VRAKWNRLGENPEPKTAKLSFPPKQVQQSANPAPKPSQPPAGNFKKVGSYQKDTPTPVSVQANDDYDKIQPGMSVEHSTFGKGKVMSVEGSGPNKKATVHFESVGQKQLLLRFAKLKF
jgi:DNA helicase-2/ATP-dependent DNA helicase PcrA